MKLRVMISCPNMIDTLGASRDELDALGVDWDIPTFQQQMLEEDLLPVIGQYDGIIAGDDQLTRKVLEAAGRLRIISKWGVGTDNVDHDAAREFGIRVTNTPGVFGHEVADVAIGYLVLLHRQLHVIDREVRAGNWHRITGRSIAGRTMVVVGLGSIGYQIVRRGGVMGMRVIGVDPSPAARQEAEAAGAATAAALGEVIGAADVLCLACPLTPETQHLVDTAMLASAPAGLMIINVSRGPLLDEDALADALGSGHVASAALDVFEVEPLGGDSPLRGMNQVVLGSHNASNTRDAAIRVNSIAIRNLAEGLGMQVAP